MLKGLGFVVGFSGSEGSSCCPSSQFLPAPRRQPPACPRLEARGPERRREPEARDQAPSSPTPSQVPGAGHPLLTGAREETCRRERGGCRKAGVPKPPWRWEVPLTQTLRARPRPPPGCRETEVAADPGQERAGEGGGDDSQRSAQGEEWSTSRAPEVRRGEAGRCAVARREGEARRLRRGEEGGERGQRTWSQPPSFPSLLPGSPRLHRTPSLPGPPHPGAQPLQKQPLPALRARLRRPPRAVRMLLPQLAPPPLARLSLSPLKLLPAAMTAPRAAGRGVRVRERAGRWGGRDGGGYRAAGWGSEGGPRGPAGRGRRARAGSGTACEDGRARHAGALASAQAAILRLLLLLSYRRISRRGGNTPLVAKVSSWTRRRTPEGPLRAREVAAPEPARLLPLSKGSTESPPLTAFSCCPPAALGQDSGRDYHWDALTAATFPSEGSVGRQDHLHEERGGFLAAAAPPNLSHILRKGGFLRQLL
ncbi:hypothetical protein AB1E18_012832 [Capra hircus]